MKNPGIAVQFRGFCLHRSNFCAIMAAEEFRVQEGLKQKQIYEAQVVHIPIL